MFSITKNKGILIPNKVTLLILSKYLNNIKHNTWKNFEVYSISGF